ncbi:MAG: Tol-Pal system beta propeller repeat protein TolB [Rickettsiales bacterium]|jgi:TolB protein|nr:Tol-Pal system beta propeller repeat protein TolB [Rickettsiales bacterium]
MKKLLVLLVVLIGLQVSAVERIDITNGKVDPMPIASPNFVANNAIAGEILQVVHNDLQGTGLFRIINKDAYIEAIQNVRKYPKFSAWRIINASALLTGEVSFTNSKEIKVEFHLWDPYGEKSIKAGIYQGKEKDWRRIAHKIADDVYKRLTGEEGYFNTKIIFIAESGPATHRIKKLAIMDQDGANLKYLTDGRNLTLTPRFSPDSYKALYLSYKDNKARVHLRDLNTQKDNILGHFKGMTFAPRFAPSGKEMAMSLAMKGSSDVMVMDLETMNYKKITSGSYINTSPYFSPDGEKIAFISDRSGASQIYVMNKDGSDQKRISFGQGRHYTPIWSPRGDFIAFTKSYQGKFYIGVMRPDGSGERILTQGYFVGNPTWSPNGRVMMYTRTEKYQGGGKPLKSNLCTIDITGNFERTLQLPTDASDANWSKLLK